MRFLQGAWRQLSSHYSHTNLWRIDHCLPPKIRTHFSLQTSKSAHWRVQEPLHVPVVERPREGCVTILVKIGRWSNRRGQQEGLGGIDRSWIGIIDVAASFALKTTRPTHAQVLCDSGSTVHAICLDHLSEDCTLRAGPRP